jgi:uncharacterized protein (TIGR00255 family)
MTGFARAEADNEAYLAEIELRSVNHRYQEIRVRVPTGLAHLEAKIRNQVASQVKRGKVDVSVRLKPKMVSDYQLELDRTLMEDFVRVARALGEELGVQGELSVSDLVGFHPALSVKERDLANGEAAWEALTQALTRALDEHDLMSQAEGAQLASDLEVRLESIVDQLEAIEGLSMSGRERRRQELVEKVSELQVSGIEPSSLAMEVARLVERTDITEELIRFRSHLSLWQDTIASEGPCGKKLDFIIQEMNREVNTIGSKCQDAAITERVIAIKSELERVREQVQNIQ